MAPNDRVERLRRSLAIYCQRQIEAASGWDYLGDWGWRPGELSYQPMGHLDVAKRPVCEWSPLPMIWLLL